MPTPLFASCRDARDRAPGDGDRRPGGDQNNDAQLMARRPLVILAGSRGHACHRQPDSGSGSRMTRTDFQTGQKQDLASCDDETVPASRASDSG